MRLMWVSFIAVAIAAASARAAEDTPETFFGPSKLHTIELKLTKHAWQLMQPERRPRPAPAIAAEMPPPDPKKLPRESPARSPAPQKPQKLPAVEGEVLAPNNFGWAFVYVKAHVKLDDQVLEDVGLRFKGNASFDNAPGTYQKPYKLDFNRFVSGRKFRGMTALNLSNNAWDAGQLRETLSYYCYTQAGLHAPRTALANLYITIDGVCDREYVGIFTIIEEPDDNTFLNTHFDATKGALFKPEGMRGLPYLGERIEPYVERYRAKTDVDPKLARRLIELVKLVNYADDDTFREKIENYLEVDGFLRYIACTMLIANLDSFLVTNHNFYLYVHPADGRVRFLPWDMNLSFGGYSTAGPGDNQIHLSVARPWAGEHNRLLERIMAIQDYDCTYRHYLWKFMDEFFNEMHMGEVIDAMEATLLRARRRAQEFGGREAQDVNPNGWALGNTLPLRSYVARKNKVVRAQLDGNTSTAFVPRPNPAFAFRWGIRAPQEYGNLALMAKAIRQSADADGDYRLSPRELRDAVAALFYELVDESNPGSIHLRRVAEGLEPLVIEKEARSRGFWGMGQKDAGSAGFIWARAVFLEADEDVDGRVSLDEAITFASRMSCLHDADQDGSMDEREIIEALDALAAPRVPGEDAEEDFSRMMRRRR